MTRRDAIKLAIAGALSPLLPIFGRARQSARGVVYNRGGLRQVWTYEYAECRRMPWYMGLAYRRLDTQTMVLWVVPLNWIVGWSRQLWRFLIRGPHRFELERKERRLAQDRLSFESEIIVRRSVSQAWEDECKRWHEELRQAKEAIPATIANRPQIYDWQEGRLVSAFDLKPGDVWLGMKVIGPGKDNETTHFEGSETFCNWHIDALIRAGNNEVSR